MLKTLEEPPPHVKFILATTDPQKIPVTVLSRCLQFNLKQMPAGHIVSHLEHILGEEHVPFEVQALRLLARAADGSMRDALSLTDQAIAYSANQVTDEAVRGMLGALDQSYLIRLLDALADGEGPAVLAVADEMSLRSLSFSTALQDLASLLHRIAWAQFAPSSVLDEWPEAMDLRRFAEALSAEQVQLFYQIATIGRSELGLAPDEYAGFTMTLLRMLAFEPAPTGGGGGGPSTTRPAGASGTGGAKRSGSPAVAASQGQAGRAAAVTPAAASTTQAVADRADAAGHETVVARGAESQTANVQESAFVPSSAESASPRESGQAARQGVPEAAGPAEENLQPAIEPTQEAALREASATATSAAEAETPVADAEAFAEDQEALPVRGESASEPAVLHSEPAVSTATSTVPLPASPAPAVRTEAPLADAAPRRAGGASAALDVLRSAGLKVSSDRGRGSATTPFAAAKPSPVVPAKPAAPRVNVPVPTPGAPRNTQEAAPARGSSATSTSAAPRNNGNGNGNGGAQGAPSVAPWDDMPPDDYVPLSAEDDYFGPPDDGYVPVFDVGPDDVRVPAAAVAPAPVPLDTRPLPPAIPLDPIGFNGDWPALAVGLALKGISYQLAFNSELMALEGSTLKLSVPVPQYAEASQVAKLKTALAERLGKELDVVVEVGPARRTAAAFDAAARAQRQKEAEREIGSDPFVQSLIREFGASIVPGSIRPIAPDAAGNAPSTH
jgi:DNA polymerase-3 subunit gamma/tau